MFAAGCGSPDGASTTEPNPSVTASASARTAAGVVGVRDPWVKAADEGMTAAFGTLVNESDVDVTLTGSGSCAARTTTMAYPPPTAPPTAA